MGKRRDVIFAEPGTEHRDVLVDVPGRAPGASGRLLVLYGRMLGPLLGGYLLLDKAFAYIHLPGTPYTSASWSSSSAALGSSPPPGTSGSRSGTSRSWRCLPHFSSGDSSGSCPDFVPTGSNAIRDFALCYYASLRSLPSRRWREPRTSLTGGSPSSPGLCHGCSSGSRSTWYLRAKWPCPRTVQRWRLVLTYKPGNAAIAALLALGCMWLFPETRSARSRALWSIMALVVMALSATQNRGGLLGVTAGAVVGLAFFPSRDRLRLIVKPSRSPPWDWSLAVQLSLKIPSPGPVVLGVAARHQRA